MPQVGLPISLPSPSLRDYGADRMLDVLMLVLATTAVILLVEIVVAGCVCALWSIRDRFNRF